MVILDSVDLSLLRHVQAEARVPVAELSKRINLSATPCALRLRKLEEQGVIEGYHARLAPKAMNLGLLVFVTVKLHSTDEVTLRAFNAAIKPLPQILECHMTGGGFDYLLKIRVRDMADYRQVLGGVIGSLSMVEGTHSYFVMEEVKETTHLPIPAHRDAKK